MGRIGMTESVSNERYIASIAGMITRLLPETGRLENVLPGVSLTRHDHDTLPEKCMCSPMAALVVQGFKNAFYGEREAGYGPGQCVVLGVDLPGVFHVSDATPGSPFLSMSVRLDRMLIAGLLAETSLGAPPEGAPASPVCVAPASRDLLDAFARLLSLAYTPGRVAIFTPMLMREIHFYLLEGSQGGVLRLFSTAGTGTNQIARAIDWLRVHFREHLQMEELARRVNMSPSSFNRGFREITSLSPLQFQKRLRLCEAQRLMLMEGMDAQSAAMSVGYESSSQFTREYKRLFGAPPRRDMERLRR